MGNTISEGLMSSKTDVMRYSIYSTLVTIKREKSINDKKEETEAKLFPIHDQPKDNFGIPYKKTSVTKRTIRQKRQKKKERILEPDVQAMLSTFKL